MVALLADGRLQVQKVDGKVTQVKLSKAVQAELMDSAKQLANAEVV